jgi:lipoic acid synthetase
LTENIAEKHRKRGPDLRKPSWLKVSIPTGSTVQFVSSTKNERSLVTVCEEAMCPNRHECWSSGTATFMLMGDTCTRACAFCAVSSGKPNGWLDLDEPRKLAEAISVLKLKYVVLTSVTRDDLPDGGAQHLADCITAIKNTVPGILVEILIPDFRGNLSALRTIVESPVDVIAHNIETVERLTPKVRDPRASYHQSLAVLENIKRMDPHRFTKSSIMVGVGETSEEILEACDDLRSSNVDFLTIGQYLRPSFKHMAVVKYVHPDSFDLYKFEALKKGFLYVASGPLVRSSYKAGEFFIENIIRKAKKDSLSQDEFIQLL